MPSNKRRCIEINWAGVNEKGVFTWQPARLYQTIWHPTRRGRRRTLSTDAYARFRTLQCLYAGWQPFGQLWHTTPFSLVYLLLQQLPIPILYGVGAFLWVDKKFLARRETAYFPNLLRWWDMFTKQGKSHESQIPYWLPRPASLFRILCWPTYARALPYDASSIWGW